MDRAKRNKRNYLQAKAAFNTRELDRCANFYAPDHRLMSQQHASPSIRNFFEQTIATWPDIQIDVEHAVAEDDWVMGKSIARATHSGTALGIPATHKLVRTSFWDLHRFNDDGLIIESWNLMDGPSLMRQITPDTGARTIAAYETYAPTYTSLVNATPSEFDAAALRRFATVDMEVLEIGSGPGYDADFVEGLGARVQRTDATRAFLNIQEARGKRCRLLNVITDDLGGPYDGVLALCVLIHVGKDQIDGVLRKIAKAIRPGGAFLVSMRDGDGETLGEYHTVYWRRDDFAARVIAAGFQLEWDAFNRDRSNEDWSVFLARKPS